MRTLNSQTTLDTPASPIDSDAAATAIRGAGKRLRPLLAFVFMTTMLTAIGCFIVTPTYEATTTILPRQAGRGNLASLLGGGLASLAASAGMGGNSLPLSLLGGSTTNTPLDLKGILDSRVITERVIQELHLDRQFPWIIRSDDLVKKVGKMRDIKAPDLKDPFITVKAQAEDPDLAADIANSYIRQLNRFLQEINYSQGRKTRRFIEQRLPLVNLNMDVAAQKLTQFQKANKTLYMPVELTESVKALGQLEAQQMAARVQSQEADRALSASTGLVSSLGGTLAPQALTELAARREALQSREKALTDAVQRFQAKTSTLPDKAVRFAYLQREYTLQETLYTLLRQQKELALIAESQEPDVFSIVDRAEAPQRPSNPKKALLVFSSLITSLFVGLVACWYLETATMPRSLPWTGKVPADPD